MNGYAKKPNGRRLTWGQASIIEVLWSDRFGWTTPRRFWERAGALPSSAYAILDEFVRLGLVETQISSEYVNAIGGPVPVYRLTETGRAWYRAQEKKSIAPAPFWILRLVGTSS
jgi:hypothetical protein